VTAMVRIYVDFNDSCSDDWEAYWNLSIDDQSLKSQAQLDKLGLKEGDNVILYQDGNDLEVIARLAWRYVDILDDTALVAVADPETYRRFPNRYSDTGA